MNTSPALYHEWLKAEDKWRTELEQAFGSNACFRRYDADQSSHPTKCRAAWLNWTLAGQRYWTSINR